MKNKKSIVNYDEDDDGGDDNLTKSNSCDKIDTDFKLSKDDHHKHSSSTSRHHHRHHHHSSSHKSSAVDYRHRSKSRSPSYQTKSSHSRDYRHHLHSRSRKDRSNSLSKNKRKSRSCRKSKRDRSRSRSREPRNHHHRQRSRSRSLQRGSHDSSKVKNKVEKSEIKLNGNEGRLNEQISLNKNTETDLNQIKPNIVANIKPVIETRPMFQPVLPEIPKYYNAKVVNPLKIAQQEQKRKLLWGDTKTKTKTEKVSAPNESVWTNLKFQGENGSKMTDKFRKLMGIRSNEGESAPSDNNTVTTTAATKGNISVNQEELFDNLDMQYSMARLTTHTHRGVGLGFGTNH